MFMITVHIFLLPSKNFFIFFFFFLMIRRPPRSTQAHTPFPTRRSSDLGVSEPNIDTSLAGKVDGISGVQIGPGATAFTRIFLSARAWDKERVRATIAPLVEE